MAIDEQLLNLPSRPDEPGGTQSGQSNPYNIAGELRASRRSRYEAPEEPASLREAVMQAKAQQAAKSAVGSSSGFNPMQKLTASLLKSAWVNLVPSFGLTMLYIDFHWFMNQVLGHKAFVDLGTEWLPVSAIKVK